MSTFARHIEAAVPNLADSAMQHEAGDKFMAVACFAVALSDLAVCARDLTWGALSEVQTKSLARQLRRIADQLDPAQVEAAQ